MLVSCEIPLMLVHMLDENLGTESTIVNIYGRKLNS